MTRNLYYKLDENKVPLPATVGDFVELIEDSKARIVQQSQVTPEVLVSTVFLGLDHNMRGGPPLVFETLVFGGDFDGEMQRYSTWAEAEAGHAAMVQRVQPDEDTEP